MIRGQHGPLFFRENYTSYNETNTKKEMFIMLNFIILTISITVAILLASALACFIVLQPKVMKWYLRYVMKMSEDIVNELNDF